jgi:hypothetical protein
VTHPSADQPRRHGRYAERHRHEADAELATDWREQPVTVMGRRFTLGNVGSGVLLHGSTADLPDGTILEPGHSRNFAESADDAVSITSDAIRADYWVNETGAGERFIYEVEPLGEVGVWRAGLANAGKSFHLYEGRVPAARIIRRMNLP